MNTRGRVEGRSIERGRKSAGVEGARVCVCVSLEALSLVNSDYAFSECPPLWTRPSLGQCAAHSIRPLYFFKGSPR